MANWWDEPNIPGGGWMGSGALDKFGNPMTGDPSAPNMPRVTEGGAGLFPGTLGATGGGIGPGGWGSGGHFGTPGEKMGQAAGGGSNAPQAGQFAATNQGFLDWANQRYPGAVNPNRPGGFVNAQAGGGLEAILREYTAATGNQANFQGGPSGDRVDFGQGVQDALTSDGYIWNANGGGGGASLGNPSGQNWQNGQNGNSRGNLSGDNWLRGVDGPGGGGFGGFGGGQGGGQFGMPQAPQMNQLQAPDPFSFTQAGPGRFESPSGVPQMQQHATPEALQYERYTGSPGDGSYDFRFQQGLKATENALAHAGALRSGNAVQALTDYGQGMASTEYAAEDARRRANVGMNNQAAFQFGQANIGNQFQATQANNQNALQQQAQGFGQGLAGFQANLGAQNQGFNQALGTHQTNAQNSLAFGAQNQNNQLANYQAQVNAQLGLGNLNLGFQNSNQNYALGQGQLGLGYQNSNNAYNLGMGNLGLAQQGQQFQQGFDTFRQNYQMNVLDPWNMNYQMANLGNPGAPNGQAYANAQSGLITDQGNANAAGQVGAANAQNGYYQQLGMSAQQLAYLQSLNQGGGNQGSYTPGQGMPPYANR